MSTKSATANPYDEIPFPAQSLPQTHPDRLAGIAMLFGMRPQPIDRCRVLELACAAGANLIPMADRHPDSLFVGIDYSEAQIEAGRRAIHQLALANIELRPMNIMDVDEKLGQFDYIIAHGVFSWVAPAVQDKLLALCKSRLAPQGVAYISYNTYPAWHLRNIIRKIVVGGTPADATARERVRRGRQILEFVSAALADDPRPFARLLKTEIDTALKQPDGYLAHEYFEVDNYPLYFHEFAERAADHGLQYLGDTTLSSMFSANLMPEIETHLLRVAHDMISIEQHMDLLRNRAFRQSLVCHDDVPLNRHLTGASLAGLRFAGQIRPETAVPAVGSTELQRFVTPNGSVVASASPTVKAALGHLGGRWPRAVSIDELLAAAATELAAAGRPPQISQQEREGLEQNLVRCLATGIVTVHCGDDRFVSSVSRCPRVSRLVRAQSIGSTNVTNRRHEAVPLDEVSGNLLRYLDGEHDRAALLQVLIEAVDSGRLSIFRNGLPASRQELLAGILEQTLDQYLDRFAASALLEE